jgi:hypothetical protein
MLGLRRKGPVIHSGVRPAGPIISCRLARLSGQRSPLPWNGSNQVMHRAYTRKHSRHTRETVFRSVPWRSRHPAFPAQRIRRVQYRRQHHHLGSVPMQQLLTEVFPLVFDPLNPETVRFGLRWKLVCADDRRATVIFEGESTT